MRDELFDLLRTVRQVGRLQIGRLLGTVHAGEGRYLAMMDLLERSMFLRAEVNALGKVLVDKGLMSQGEWLSRQVEEYRLYVKDLASEWPEVELSPTGYTVKDVPAFAARARAEQWPP